MFVKPLFFVEALTSFLSGNIIKKPSFSTRGIYEGSTCPGCLCTCGGHLKTGNMTNREVFCRTIHVAPGILDILKNGAQLAAAAEKALTSFFTATPQAAMNTARESALGRFIRPFSNGQRHMPQKNEVNTFLAAFGGVGCQSYDKMVLNHFIKK